MVLQLTFHPILSFPRPRKNPVEGGGRDLVCPIILKQSNPLLEQEEEDTDDEADKCFKDIIRIGENLDFIQFFSFYQSLCDCYTGIHYDNRRGSVLLERI